MRWQGVPSWTSPSATTLNATGRVLFDRQWVGRVEQTMCGEPVRVSSPGCSAMSESIVLSAKFSAVSGESRPEPAVADPPFVEFAEEFRWLLAPEFCSGGAVVDVTSDAMCIFIPLSGLQIFTIFLAQQKLLSNNKIPPSVITFNNFPPSQQIKARKIRPVRSRSLQECFCHRENLSSANPFRSVMFCGLRKRRIKIIITRPKKKLHDGDDGESLPLRFRFLAAENGCGGVWAKFCCLYCHFFSLPLLRKSLSSNPHRRVVRWRR